VVGDEEIKKLLTLLIACEAVNGETFTTKVLKVRLTPSRNSGKG